MIIYYLYLENDGILSDVEMNFHANHRFHFDPSKKTLDKVRTTQIVPKDFFKCSDPCGVVDKAKPHVGKGDATSPIDAISVIIGDNGSGKTSVASALSKIILGRYRGSFVIVFELNPNEIRYASSYDDVETKILKVSLEGGAGCGFAMCYHSPHFVPYAVVRSDDGRVGDVSSGKLVSKEANVSDYEDEETRRLYEFLAIASENGDWLRESFGLNEPLGLAILGDKTTREDTEEWVEQEIEGDALSDSRRWVNEKIDNDKTIGTEELRKIREVLSRRYEDPISSAFVLLMSLSWRKTYSSHMNGSRWQFRDQLAFCERLAVPIVQEESRGLTEQIMLKRWDEIIEYTKGREGQRIATCLSCVCSDVEKHERMVKFVCAMRDVFSRCYWLLNQEHNGHSALKTVFNKQVAINEMGMCLRLVHAHAMLGPQTRVLRFGTYPRMSAGERSSLALWSRLYEWLANHRQFDGNCVVFLDEAETTLHPALQRRLVSNMLLFFEHLFPSMHVHVIFATHSPNLLSDIPIGNVVLLRRGESQLSKPKTSIAESAKLPETFGSNVFDLYYKHFNLDKGPVGLFASTKIAQLLQKYKRAGNRIHVSQEDRQLLDMIGDDFIRGYIMLRVGGADHDKA